jgi:hypothetical protein
MVALKKNNQVVKFVENVWGTDNDFREKAEEYFQGDPVRTQAGEFGYVRRDRAWWGVGKKGNLATIDAKMPVGVTVMKEKGIVRLVWQGKRPMPDNFQAEGYFDLALRPEDIMKASGKGRYGDAEPGVLPSGNEGDPEESLAGGYASFRRV